MTIDLFVPGIPRPAGSKRGFALKKAGVYTGRVVITDDCKESRDWKNRVAQEAASVMSAINLRTLLEGPLRVAITFYLPRPKAHFRTGKHASSLRDKAPVHPDKKPDALKLARAVEDALTGVVWRDDAQIVTEHISKRYGHRPGVGVVIGTEE